MLAPFRNEERISTAPNGASSPAQPNNIGQLDRPEEAAKRPATKAFIGRPPKNKGIRLVAGIQQGEKYCQYGKKKGKEKNLQGNKIAKLIINVFNHR